MMNPEKSLHLALEWLSGPATVKDNQPVGERGRRFSYAEWNGAIRGEYEAAHRRWDSFCPVWHTGQAVKAFVLAARTLHESRWLDAARFSASFLLNQQILSGPDAGLILAFEDHADLVNISAILEALDGLFLLSETTGENRYRDSALSALQWVAEHAWQEKTGRFYDLYSPERHKFIFGVYGSQNRPLLDDAVFLKGFQLSGNRLFREIAFATAETLLADENPPGNWIRYIPCDSNAGFIHPRHAYWWGNPMLDLYRESGDSRFLDAFIRSVEWYRHAIRRDGGLFRDTYTDFSTPSFGHAASGSACAALCFERYFSISGDPSILPDLENTLNFCMRMQFTRAEDPNLQGAVLEKVCFPDGSDRSPYHLRDLGTIFFIQAAALCPALRANGKNSGKIGMKTGEQSVGDAPEPSARGRAIMDFVET